MWGPPGSGKTLLARCMPGLVPELTPDAAVEVAQVWSAAGRSDAPRRYPPFRAPHHTATVAALVGGGSGIVTPGEISLAHHGLLFLDELGEFPTNLLDALRQPVEEGWVTVARSGRSVTFPANVQLVAATNPCPCGFEGDRAVACRCRPSGVERYRRRLSGPLLDRFDLRVAVSRPGSSALSGPAGESSADVRSRVIAARRRQAAQRVAQPVARSAPPRRPPLGIGRCRSARASSGEERPQRTRLRPGAAGGAHSGRPVRQRCRHRGAHRRSTLLSGVVVISDARLVLACVGLHPERSAALVASLGSPDAVVAALRAGRVKATQPVREAASVNVTRMAPAARHWRVARC